MIDFEAEGLLDGVEGEGREARRELPERLAGEGVPLEELREAVAEPPVRLVKLIGDAAMLVSTDAEAMVVAALRMVESADGEGEDFPRLRAGIAFGSALVRTGDYYGRPVNLASRLTGIAKPGSVLVDEAAMEAAGEAFEYSYAGERRLKGFDSRVKLFRARSSP